MRQTTDLASSALVNSMMALALFTSKLVMILRNFPSSALEGTFSWTATQMFRLAAWGLQTVSNCPTITTHYHFLKHINARLPIGAFTCYGRDVCPVEKVYNINKSESLEQEIDLVQFKFNWSLWNISSIFYILPERCPEELPGRTAQTWPCQIKTGDENIKPNYLSPVTLLLLLYRRKIFIDRISIWWFP